MLLIVHVLNAIVPSFNVEAGHQTVSLPTRTYDDKHEGICKARLS